MKPVDDAHDRPTSPIFSYPYTAARDARGGMAALQDPAPVTGFKMEYLDPIDGGPAIPTCMRLLPAGFRGMPVRATDHAVYSAVGPPDTLPTSTSFRPRSGSCARRMYPGPRNDLGRRQCDRPRQLDAAGRDALLALGEDLQRAREVPTTTPRDKKELPRTVLAEVIVLAPRGEHYIRLTLRWETGLLSNIERDRPKTRRAAVRTDDDTIDLLRRLAQFHSDAMIAGILDRQGKTTAYGYPW